MFPSLGFKLPTNEPPDGSEQPTGNKTMATGEAIIVVNSPTPVAAMALPATESPVSSPSMTLAPAGISYTAML